MYKLVNPILHYHWGSYTAFDELFDIPNDTNRPMAELWMGAQPSRSSLICIEDE